MRLGRFFVCLPLVFALVTFAAGAAEADETQAQETTPAFTLVVDSDDDRVSFDAIAPRLAAELGASVGPAGQAPSNAAITVVHREGRLTVRAVHGGGRVLEREIRAAGDAEAVVREAVLLASNLARDEARELIDELARRAPEAPEPKPSEEAPSAPPPAPEVEEEEQRAATFAVAYPVATNAGSPNVRSGFNVDLFYGRVGRSTGLQLSLGGAAYASRGVSGAQIGTLAAVSGGEVHGAQVAGLANVAGGEVRGAQIAGLFAWGGPADGLQMAGAFDRATSLVGAQVSGVFNASGPVDGLQITGAVNVGARVDGAQIAGGLNLARGSAKGLQMGAVDITSGDVVGAQVSGALSLATERIDGVQIALVNVAKEVHGVQIGGVNVAKRPRGLQVGVVNVAEEADEAIGLVTIARNSVHPIAWASNLAYTNAGIKFTSRHLYTLAAIGFGTNEIALGDDGFVITSGLGGHFGIGAFDVETELAYSHVEGRPERNHALHPRVLGGYSFFDHLRVFAGGGVRVPIQSELGRNVVRPEVVAGVQF